MDNMSWAHVLSFLPPNDILEVMCASKHMYGVCHSELLFSNLITQYVINSPCKFSIPFKEYLRPGSQMAVFRSILPMLTLKRARWLDVTNNIENTEAALEPVEGHGMALVKERYLVLRSGYVVSGPELQTAVLDLNPGGEEGPLSMKRMRWVNINEPRYVSQSVYGQTLTALPDGRLLQYGGCRNGGYFDATDFSAYMSLSFNDESNEVEVTWQENAPTSINNPKSGIGSTSYHCAIPIPSQPYKLILFGGINSTHSISTLSVLDCESNSWIPLAPPTGDIPTGRYGFASGVVGDRFWVIGGADGDDIRQRGQDLRDVYFVHVSDLLERNLVVWHRCDVEVPNNMFGRETSSVVFGTKIVAIGGSMNNMHADEVTNNFYYFDTATHQFGTIRSFEEGLPPLDTTKRDNQTGDGTANDEEEEGEDEDAPFEAIPPCHLSSEAVLIGKYFMCFGGWTKEGLLDGPFVADLNIEKEKDDDEEVIVESAKNLVVPEVRFAIRNLIETQLGGTN
eukprot:m.208581 g.208581  ORF g.208581 m.208581 type:complete len:509 (+) comp13767_c0_seq2:1897-3423(+)